MNRISSKIIMLVLILGIFLLPISPSLERIKAEAQTQYEQYQNLFPGSTITLNSLNYDSASFDIHIIGNQADWDKTRFVNSTYVAPLKPTLSVNENSTVLVLKQNGNYVAYKDLSSEVKSGSKVLVDWSITTIIVYSIDGPVDLISNKSFNSLSPETNYTAELYIKSKDPGNGGGADFPFGSGEKNYYKFGNTESFSTPKEGDLGIIGPDPQPNSVIAPLVFDCGITSLDKVLGCVAGISYSLWEVSAQIATLAGKILDFFVYYSTNSDAYKSGFVTKGWGAIRDVANIFFIIALLYIAIKTILNLNVTNNKKLIGTIVIVALLINFSLFFTQVIIDGSNILAKIFYNNINSKDPGGQPASGSEGEKSISVGLIKGYNPQRIISKQNEYDASRATFIFITLLLIAITLYTAFIFFTVSLLFVGRVISLWISMIFSPVAFASYTLPFDIPGLGHKTWWSELLKNAFLAPIFVFFLYIIIMFTGFLGEIVKYDISGGSSWDVRMLKLMSVIIPFIIIAGLLMKAKKLAVEYSGEIGKGISTFGKVVGGAALGLATGGVAMLGRRVIGGGGSYIANKLASRAESAGMAKTALRLRDFSKFAQKSSFDVRGIKVAGKNLGSATGLKVGEAQKGGWAEMKKKQDERRTKRAEELKKYGTGTEKKKLADEEAKLNKAGLQEIVATVAGTTATMPIKLHIENLNKEIDKARIAMRDAKDSDLNDGSAASLAAKAEVVAAKRRIDVAQAEKDRLRSTGGANSIENLERNKNLATVNVEAKENEIMNTYTDKISSKGNKIKNVIFRGGAYSVAGADETARNLRVGKKVDSGEKPH
jgi:hypothetical protein